MIEAKMVYFGTLAITLLAAFFIGVSTSTRTRRTASPSGASGNKLDKRDCYLGPWACEIANGVQEIITCDATGNYVVVGECGSGERCAFGADNVPHCISS